MPAAPCSPAVGPASRQHVADRGTLLVHGSYHRRQPRQRGCRDRSATLADRDLQRAVGIGGLVDERGNLGGGQLRGCDIAFA